MSEVVLKIDSVLLIDDNEIDNFVNKEMLTASSFSKNIFSYTSPTNAIESLKEIGASNDISAVPSIIFLDINMPKMNGFEFLMEFEKLPEVILNKTKIVILTSSLNNTDLISATSNEFVTDYLEKPLTEEALEKIRSHF